MAWLDRSMATIVASPGSVSVRFGHFYLVLFFFCLWRLVFFLLSPFLSLSLSLCSLKIYFLVCLLSLWFLSCLLDWCGFVVLFRMPF